MNQSTSNPKAQSLIDKLEELEYQEIRDIDGMLVGIFRFLFTCGVVYGLDEGGYKGRFCFNTWQNASLFLKEWDGKTPPVIGEDGCKAIK